MNTLFDTSAADAAADHKSTAQKTIETMGEYFIGEYRGGKLADNNMETIDFLNDNCVQVVDLYDQETWIQDDNSYITRIEDVYFVGDDADFFKSTGSN